jgi:AcrR family transcriptional regulator
MTSRPGRPRDSSVDDRISRAALDLLREHGPEAVHIEAVATRSGTARTTIYRRFRNREALIAATLDRFAESPFPTAETPVEDKLRWVLEHAHELVEEQLGRGAIAATLAESDPVFSKALRELLKRRLEAIQHEIDADVARGRLRRGLDAESLAGLAFGAYLGEVLQHGQPRPGWANAVVRILLNGVGA